MSKSRPCPICKGDLHSVFDATDHQLLEGEGKFDPYLIMAGGYKLHLGSLLRKIWKTSDDPEHVRDICESTYGLLYLAETSPESLDAVFQEIYEEESE